MFGFSDDLIKRISKKCSNLARVLEEIIVKVMFQGHGTVQMTDSIGDARFTVHLDQKYLDAREHASISSYMGCELMTMGLTLSGENIDVPYDNGPTIPKLFGEEH